MLGIDLFRFGSNGMHEKVHRYLSTKNVFTLGIKDMSIFEHMLNMSFGCLGIHS